MVAATLQPRRLAAAAASPLRQPPAHASLAAQRPASLRAHIVAHAKPKGKAAAPPPPKPAPKPQQQPVDVADDEGGEWDEDGEEGEDVGEDGFLDEDEMDEEEEEAFEDEFDLGSDDLERGVVTNNETWAEVALRAAREVLSKPSMQGLELYLFHAYPANKKIDIRLDKMDDLYGSPSIDDIEKFSRMLLAALEVALGVEASGEVSLEVSSPGAERQLKLPEELARFSELALRVRAGRGGGGVLGKGGEHGGALALAVL